jgi:hypothetical protein
MLQQSVALLLDFGMNDALRFSICVMGDQPFTLCSVHLCSCRALSLGVLGMKK